MTTFRGSLGEFIGLIREFIKTGDLTEIQRYCLDIMHGRSVSFINGIGDTAVEYYKNPRCGFELIRQGRMRLNVPFLDTDIPELISEVVEPLYPAYGDNKRVKRLFKILCDDIKKAKQAFKQSYRVPRCVRANTANDRISEALKHFDNSMKELLPDWRNSSVPKNGSKKLDNLMTLMELPGSLKQSGKYGRPPKVFNILLFHTVNKFTFRFHDKERKPIIINGKFRARKNWRLICLALLWIHVIYDIPEIRLFIQENKNEKTNEALRVLQGFVKREYQNFRRSGKGSGKFIKPFHNGSEWLGYHFFYIKRNTLKFKLV